MNKQVAFVNRHIGPSAQERSEMLQAMGYDSLDAFIDKVVPKEIRRESMDLPAAVSETEALAEIAAIGKKNKLLRSLIGQGYYDCHVPSVILRNIFENPGWYTSYTPYQAEISQGRLEALLNFQTMVADLTAMEIANASLLDEASAAAEAMMLAKRQSKAQSARFIVNSHTHPQVIDVIKTRAMTNGVEVVVTDNIAAEMNDCFGAYLQYPCTNGGIADFSDLAEQLHQKKALLCVGTDLLALTLLKAPGEMGADIVVGNSQRFGVPLGFGGPHAAFMATRDSFKRQMPGRLVGVSIDSKGKKAYRLTLQAREQHIRREKATSNICTAQALLAVMAGAYAVYHGAEGLKAIAGKVHTLTTTLAASLIKAGMTLEHQSFFDTIVCRFADKASADAAMKRGLEKGINFRRVDDCRVGVSLDERSELAEVAIVLHALSGNEKASVEEAHAAIPAALQRKSAFLTHASFNRYHNETDMMRYLRRLSDFDLALDRCMIPLGSCTMKLNSASSMMPLSWAEFTGLHPFVPEDQAAGYHEMFKQLEAWLCELTGYDAVSLQPNSGAHGEYTGLLTIRAYHHSRGEGHRNICLIPSSAHGTNPASAHLAGMEVVIVNCDEHGNIDLDDLRQKANEHRDNLAAIMVTYPSTHGVFEQGIRELCKIVHDAGGQVYLDGANFNAQVGLGAPGLYGSDVSHLNLHKTFAIPHGGGGPGVGPIGVRAHLAPFLPGHVVTDNGHNQPAVSAAAWGSALVEIISWMYIRMMGGEGLKRASEVALLNANYIAHRLRAGGYHVLYSDENGMVAHECIIDMREFKDRANISVDDIAKRLIDYGFHAPTMSFPVAGTLMVEPTESEPKAELDRFCDAMLAILEEIKHVEQGVWQQDDNPLVNAPHTLADLTGEWTHSYDRKTAIFPLEGMNPAKYFPPVNRIDNVYGDRNVMCACPPTEDYQN